MIVDNSQGVKHRDEAKTARIPIKIVPVNEILKKPEWIKVKIPSGERFKEVKI